MPSRMTTPHSLLLHALFAVFWVLLLDALRLRALGCPLSPHQYGVSFGCLVAGTLDNSGFHLVQTSGLSRGWLTRHAPELGQFLPCDKLTLGHRCCPLIREIVPFSLASPAFFRRSLIDLSCLVWLPNCLFGRLPLPTIRPILFGRAAYALFPRPTSIGVLRTQFNIPRVVCELTDSPHFCPGCSLMVSLLSS